MHGHSQGAGLSFGEGIVFLPLAAAALIYFVAALAEGAKGRPWPWWRLTCWLAGLGVAAIAISGVAFAPPGRPFTDHAIKHVLVGMLAPLLLVLAAPVTLALRSFSVLPARRLSRALRSMPARVLAHPLVAALLNVGGLYLLYLTPLYESTSGPFLHVVVMVHILMTGFLFTAAIIPVDPSPHRASVTMRLVVLTVSLAAHGVLAKALYASALEGAGVLPGLVRVTGAAAVDLQAGAQVMFYGGDLIDLALVVLVLFGWYRAAGRRRRDGTVRMLVRGTRPRFDRGVPARLGGAA